MIGMRNRIAHDYPGVDDNTICDTIQIRIPELIMQPELIAPPDPSAEISEG
jgi:uncharacterized protein with HEPN domain